MSKLSEQLAILKRQYDKEYNPETAFGNVALIAIQEKIADIQLILDENWECSECNGYGNTECSECGHDKFCDNCNGTGLLAKNDE